MGRRRFPSLVIYEEWGTQRERLSSTFGGIDRDIERIFLSMAPADLSLLLYYYEEEFGRSAATYARKTYPRWKCRKVRMSGQVAERLLSLVPPLLSQEERFKLIKKLRIANLRKLDLRVDSAPDQWREALAPAIRELVDHGAAALIPDAVKARAAWLADGDTQAAEALLRAAELDEAVGRLAYLEEEFRQLDAMVAELQNHQHTISKVIELPQGRIRVTIAPPKLSLWQRVTKWVG